MTARIETPPLSREIRMLVQQARRKYDSYGSLADLQAKMLRTRDTSSLGFTILMQAIESAIAYELTAKARG